MDIQGKIIQVLPIREGQSARGAWTLASYVLETIENYPKHICFEVFGADKIQQMNIQAGGVYKVYIDIDAREHEGRWFNSIRAWKVEPQATQPVQATQAPQYAPAPQAAPTPQYAQANAPIPTPPQPNGESDLPF